jgi:hypothetical protein
MSTVEFSQSNVRVDAALIAKDLGLAPEHVLNATRAGRLTAVVEQGIAEDAGRMRLTFYHRHRCLRLIVDESGQVLERSAMRLRPRKRRNYNSRDGSD